MVIPDHDGRFSAEIVEFPGCIAEGETASEALKNLEEVAADWIRAALAQGQDVPEPMETAGYSGKLVLRMPKSLHQRASLYAERDGVSLNQFIVACIAENVGTRARPVALAQPMLTVSHSTIMSMIAPNALMSGAPNTLISGVGTMPGHVHSWSAQQAILVQNTPTGLSGLVKQTEREAANA
jgi:predicted RNase H-like HicB family nuclease